MGHFRRRWVMYPSSSNLQTRQIAGETTEWSGVENGHKIHQNAKMPIFDRRERGPAAFADQVAWLATQTGPLGRRDNLGTTRIAGELIELSGA
mmetsp:Transcript_31400/g.100881  ORF Transcript_31400/g.100881 Transcript_31400/m.100881 type:complete len:93 (-) Transcript_31400:150-428(-)